MFYTPDKKGFVRISYVFLAPLTHNLCSVVCVPRIFFSLGKTSLENISLAKGHNISEIFFLVFKKLTKILKISALVFKKGLKIKALMYYVK